MTRRRAWIALLIFLAVIINYMDRIALSVAAKPIVAEFGFTPVQMGYLFSGFLWTYVVCLVPLGMLVDRIGAKRMVGGGIAIWSAATAATAAMGSFGGIIACRLVMGASEATTFPAGGRVIRDWFPDRERGLVTTLFNGGSSAGPALGAIITAALVSWFDWRTAFVVLGAFGFVWLTAWLVWYGPPDEVTWLPAAERAKILSERNGDSEPVHEAPPPSSLGHLLSQSTVWGLVLTQACLVYTAYLFLTWLPTYLQSTRELSTMNTGYLTAAPYLATIVLGLAVARLSDRLLSSADIQAGRRRNFIAAMAALALLKEDDALKSIPVVAITAFGGNLFGLIAPIITGYVVSGTGGYTWAFRIAAVLLLGAVVATLTMTRKPIASQHACLVAA